MLHFGKRFRLLRVAASLFFLSVKVCAAQTGSISASPSHLVIEPGQLGNTSISWTTTGEATAQVYVSQPGVAEKLMSEGPSGTTSVPWIQPGSPYVFRLYAGTSHSQLLAWTSVTTQNPPGNMFGFDYWPNNHGDDTLYNANWPSLSPTVQADLDHISSLSGGVIRIFFWPQTSGFIITAGQGGKITETLSEVTSNLPSFLKLCADRNIKVIIVFGNNYYDEVDSNTNENWWMEAYGNTSQGFASFLHDTATWMNAIIDSVESSPYASSVIYYDMENEYYKDTTNAQWYISFVYDWTDIPDGKRGVSVLHVPSDSDDLAFALAASGGPKLGIRRLDYVDFHSYIDSKSYPNYSSNTPSQAAASLRSTFPGATVLMGEFGYSVSPTSQNGSSDAITQEKADLQTINDAKAAGVSYYLHWLLWDAIAPSASSTSFGNNPSTPRNVLGGVSSVLNLASNPDMENVSSGAPVSWGVGGTIPVVLSSQSGYGPGNAASNFYYARVTAQQGSGSVWLTSNMIPVKGNRQLFLNAYIRSSMSNVGMGVAEYDANKNPLRNDTGPTFNPTGWSYYNYLQQISSTCSGAAILEDQCSWNVTLLPNTAWVIVTVNGRPDLAPPTYLDVDTVSVWQRP